MARLVSHSAGNAVWGVFRPGWAARVGLWQARLHPGGRNLWHEMHPRRIRWGRVLLVAIAVLIMMGECGPAVSAIVILL